MQRHDQPNLSSAFLSSYQPFSWSEESHLARLLIMNREEYRQETYAGTVNDSRFILEFHDPLFFPAESISRCANPSLLETSVTLTDHRQVIPSQVPDSAGTQRRPRVAPLSNGQIDQKLTMRTSPPIQHSHTAQWIDVPSNTFQTLTPFSANETSDDHLAQFDLLPWKLDHQPFFDTREVGGSSTIDHGGLAQLHPCNMKELSCTPNAIASSTSSNDVTRFPVEEPQILLQTLDVSVDCAKRDRTVPFPLGPTIEDRYLLSDKSLLVGFQPTRYAAPYTKTAHHLSSNEQIPSSSGSLASARPRYFEGCKSNRTETAATRKRKKRELVSKARGNFLDLIHGE